MSTARTLITGGRVLHGDPLAGGVSRTDLLIEDGTITAIEPDLSSADAEVIDASGCWVIPGFVDTHRHLWQTTMRGVTANWNLKDYYWCIRSHFAGLHDPDDAYAGQYAGGLDALSCGVTTTIDHSHITNSPDHSDAAVTGIADSGVRALWCYGFYPSPQADPVFTTPQHRLDDARRIRTTFFPNDNGLVRMGVALTELGMQPLAETRREIETGRDIAVPVTMHTNCVWGRPEINDVAVYQRAGLLHEGQIHSHANKCTEADLRALREAGCSVASTPDTELQMGQGRPVFRRALAAGVTAGMGIDIVSNNSGDMFTAMRVLMQHDRGDALQGVLEESGLSAVSDPLPVTTRQILHAATLSGATALGLESVCGTIDVGKAADLVLLRHNRLHMQPIIDDVDSIVMQATTRDIDRVIVAGRTVVENGSLPVDVERRGMELIAAANARLTERVAPLGGWKLPVPSGLLDEMGALFHANVTEPDLAE